MRQKMLSLVLLLALFGTLTAGCGPVATPEPVSTTQPAATDELPAAPVPDPARARDAALAYAAQNYGLTPPPASGWVEKDATPQGLVGRSAQEYTVTGWAGLVTVSAPVVAPENVLYTVAISDPSTGFRWEGTVDAGFQTIETLSLIPAGVTVQGALGALQAVLTFLQGQAADQTPVAAQAWAEENITPDKLLGYSTFRYIAGDWEAKVGFPIVPLESTIYEVELSNLATGFHWQGHVDAAGKVQELAAQPTPAERPPAGSPSDEAALVQGNNAFAFDLYQALRGGGKNLFFSPYSISAALAMTYSGARGQTEQEMAAALHLLLGQERLHPAFGALAELLAGRGQGAAGKDDQGFRLHIVNRLWGQSGYDFLSEFLSLLAASYGAGLERLDFARDPDGARRTINNWVSEQTEGRIEDLIARGLITPITRLVLTNAVYFNAAWQHPFHEESTADGPFYCLDGKQVTVPMMHQAESLGYAEGPGYQVVDLPYDGRELSMAILLPDEGQFEAFEAALNAEQVAGILAALDGRRVVLTMPKFEMRSEFSLGDTLAAMGMPTAFGSDADFSGMTGTRDLFISAIVHQAFVSVDEAGTEAAAATAVVMEKLSMAVEEPPVEVTVDRPFLFLIRDRETGTILFVGRVLDPTA